MTTPAHPDHLGDDRGDDALTMLLASIEPADRAATAAARERQARLTKPPGSLGALEEVSVRLSGLAGECPPPLPEPAAVAVFAADHGVHAQGVTPWPQEVTGQMVANFAAGGAAVNVLARQAGAAVLVVDVGMAGPAAGDDGPLGVEDLTVASPLLMHRRVRSGTGDISREPAMTRAQAVAAIEVGTAVAQALVAAGYRCLLTGDMGIANTTASAALIAAFTGSDAAAVTGRGTGVDDATYARKVAVVGTALERHRDVVASGDPVEILAALGGLEHAALAGFLLGAAAARVPAVLDGVIAGAAALVAQRMAPAAVDAWFAGHRSAEPGHAVALRALGLTPLIDLGLRLGEGTGALIALPLVRAAAATLGEMATFDSAGVTQKSP